MKVKPSDFSHTIELGTNKTVKNKAGLGVPTFVPAYKLHYKQQKRTLGQTYSLIGTRLDYSITVIVRHDARNEEQRQAKIGGHVYDVRDVSSDDSNEAIRFDYLTLVDSKKGA